MTSDEIEKMRKESEDYNKRGFGRWSWYMMIDTLSGGDILKHEAVCELNFIACLNKLSFIKEKSNEDKRREDIQKQNR